MIDPFKFETIDEIDFFEETGLLYPIGIRTRADADAWLEHLENNEQNTDLLAALNEASDQTKD